MTLSLFLAVLLYVGLDFSLAAMPGAFEFDPGDSVESVQVKRARTASDVAAGPIRAVDAIVLPEPPISGKDAAVSAGAMVATPRPVVSRLPRSGLLPTSPAEDPH